MGVGGGANEVDDREGCIFFCEDTVVFVLTEVTGGGEGVEELAVIVGSGSGELFTASGVLFTSASKTGSIVALALGYKSPIAVWIVFGNKSLDIFEGAAVIIVTNKKAEKAGTRNSVHFLFVIVLMLYILSLSGVRIANN